MRAVPIASRLYWIRLAYSKCLRGDQHLLLLPEIGAKAETNAVQVLQHDPQAYWPGSWIAYRPQEDFPGAVAFVVQLRTLSASERWLRFQQGRLEIPQLGEIDLLFDDSGDIIERETVLPPDPGPRVP